MSDLLWRNTNTINHNPVSYLLFSQELYLLLLPDERQIPRYVSDNIRQTDRHSLNATK